MADTVLKIDESYFQTECLQSMYVSAVNVMAEDPGTANHAERVALAGKLFNNQISGRMLAMTFMTNATLKGKIEADQAYASDMDFVATTLYNHLALSL